MEDKYRMEESSARIVIYIKIMQDISEFNLKICDVELLNLNST